MTARWAVRSASGTEPQREGGPLAVDEDESFDAVISTNIAFPFGEGGPLAGDEGKSLKGAKRNSSLLPHQGFWVLVIIASSNLIPSSVISFGNATFSKGEGFKKKKYSLTRVFLLFIFPVSLRPR